MNNVSYPPVPDVQACAERAASYVSVGMRPRDALKKVLIEAVGEEVATLLTVVGATGSTGVGIIMDAACVAVCTRRGHHEWQIVNLGSSTMARGCGTCDLLASTFCKNRGAHDYAEFEVFDKDTGKMIPAGRRCKECHMVPPEDLAEPAPDNRILK